MKNKEMDLHLPATQATRQIQTNANNVKARMVQVKKILTCGLLYTLSILIKSNKTDNS